MFFRRKIKELESLVEASRKSLRRAEDQIRQRNKLIENQHNENKELKSRITDLENNVELLVNNLTPKKRELVRPDNQN